mmetsp:Transcript_13662/g.34889  ORF Transcript_13662/g.34889 Transcript_13662/m.34889 type:complete len:309 (+) Transcript_13662:123-1049(+)
MAFPPFHISFPWRVSMLQSQSPRSRARLSHLRSPRTRGMTCARHTSISACSSPANGPGEAGVRETRHPSRSRLTARSRQAHGHRAWVSGHHAPAAEVTSLAALLAASRASHSSHAAPTASCSGSVEGGEGGRSLPGLRCGQPRGWSNPHFRLPQPRPARHWRPPNLSLHRTHPSAAPPRDATAAALSLARHSAQPSPPTAAAPPAPPSPAEMSEVASSSGDGAPAAAREWRLAPALRSERAWSGERCATWCSAVLQPALRRSHAASAACPWAVAIASAVHRSVGGPWRRAPYVERSAARGRLPSSHAR